jgi:DNA-binding LacI/PurR family transcriptional regulator
MNILEKVHVNSRLDTPIVVQLKEQLTWLISSGQIQDGELLPSVRKMASHLGINLHTVREAYHRLEVQGLVETRQGVGTQVLPYDPGRLLVIGGQMPSHTVGVIIPNLGNPLYTEYIRGVESITHPEHILLLVCDAHDEPEEALLYFRKLVEKGVDGILVFSFGILEDLPGVPINEKPAFSTPFVTVDWLDIGGYTVLCDFQEGIRQAVAHLVSHGHRRIGLIEFSLDIPAMQQIKAGFLQALGEAGIKHERELVVPIYGFKIADGEAAARVFLRLPNPPTAILAMSDLIAIGALKVLKTAGLQVPQDIALVGVNDIPLAGLVDPPLTTVHQPAYQMGREAMRLLQSLISEKPPPLRQIILPTSLVIRQSCGCK